MNTKKILRGIALLLIILAGLFGAIAAVLILSGLHVLTAPEALVVIGLVGIAMAINTITFSIYLYNQTKDHLPQLFDWLEKQFEES